MGILEGRAISSLSDEEERWRRSLVNGSPGARIPDGESMGEITKRMFTALEECRSLPAGSLPLLVSVNDHRKLIHFLSKSDQSKLIHCFTQLLLLSAAYLSIGSFHRLIAVHANDEVKDQA